MFYTYILYSLKSKDFYYGTTGDLKKRFEEHNKGLSKSTKAFLPLELIHYEAYRNMKDAYNREKQIKSGPGREYIKRRLKRFLSLTG